MTQQATTADQAQAQAQGQAKGRPAGYRQALEELRGRQKAAKGVSLYSRYVNRPVGRRLAAASYVARLSPNQVTGVSAVLSFAGIAALAVLPPSWPLAVGVYLALALGFAFDSADGQLARLRRESSAAGEWLDHVVDAGKTVALHAAVLITFELHFDLPGRGWLLLPLAFQFAAVVTFFGGLLREKLGPKAVPGAAAAPPPSRVRAVALLPVDYGVLCVLFLLLGNETAFRWGYAAFFAAQAAFLVAFGVKWFRELSAPTSVD